MYILLNFVLEQSPCRNWGDIVGCKYEGEENICKQIRHDVTGEPVCSFSETI